MAARSVPFGLVRLCVGADTDSMDRSSSKELPIEGPPSQDGRPTHDAAGVDLTLIREALAMTPAERLRALTEMMASLARLAPDR